MKRSAYPYCKCGVQLDDTNYENGQCKECSDKDFEEYVKYLEEKYPDEYSPVIPD